MKFININSLICGNTLAKPIFDKNSRLLLRQGAVIEKKHIALLKQFEIEGVFIEKTNEIQSNDDTLNDEIDKSDFTELSIGLEIGIPKNEALTLPILKNRIESFLTSISKIYDMPIIHVTIGPEFPSYIKNFTKPSPEEFTPNYQLNTYHLADILVIVYSKKNDALVTEDLNLLWYKYANTIYCLNCTNIIKKDKYTPKIDVDFIPMENGDTDLLQK